AAFSASRTAKPSISKPARMNRRMCGSSSMTRTAAWDLVMVEVRSLLNGGLVGAHANRNRRAEPESLGLRLQGAAVGGDKAVRNPQTKPRARNQIAMALAAERRLPDPGRLGVGQPAAAVAHREHDLLMLEPRRDADQRSRGRIFCGVLDQLSDR